MRHLLIYIVFCLTLLPRPCHAWDETTDEAPQALDVADALQNGLYYPTPIPLKKDFKEFGISMSLDTLRFARGTDPTGTDDDYTALDAWVQIQLPFLDHTNGNDLVRFSGKNIKLRGGKAAVSRIGLDKCPPFNFSKDIKLQFLQTMPTAGSGEIQCAKGDSTWVDFTCNGVEAFSLIGCFTFNSTLLTPATAGKDSVRAYFVMTSDGGTIAKICFADSFKVRGCGDFVFTIKDALVDFSSKRNSPGFAFPVADYWPANIPQEGWTGFFLDQLTVSFPKEFLSRKSSAQPKIELSKMLIDDYGFSGSVLATNIINTIDDAQKKDGLRVALDSLRMVFLKNRPIDGLISGRAETGFMEEDGNNGDGKDEITDGMKLGLRGSVGYNAGLNKYIFDVKATLNTNKKYKVPFTKIAHISIYKGSYLEVYNNEEKDFAARLKMSGQLDIDWKFSMKGISFQGLQLSTEKPHVDIEGLGMVGTAGFSLSGMGIELNKLEWKKLSDYGVLGNGKSWENGGGLGITARISLIPGANTLAATLGATIYAGYANSHWQFAKLQMNQICLETDFSAFRFKGCVTRYDDDVKYGDGFSGLLQLTLKALGFHIDGGARFGRVNGKHYWFAAAEVEFGNTPMLLFPPCVFMKSATGGAYQHMKRNQVYDPENPDKGFNWDNIKLRPDNFVPDENMGMGFILGIGIYVANAHAVSANVVFDMGFTDHWGIDHISLIGTASVLAAIEKDKTNPKGMITGQLYANYDVPNKTFVCGIDVKADIAGIITGSASTTMYVSPKDWYFWIGSYNKPCQLKILDLIKARTYFMLGKVPGKLVPLNTEIAKYFDIFQVKDSEGKEGLYHDGKGFAFGADVTAMAKLALPADIFWASFYAAAGADMLIYNNAACNNKKLDWRGYGDSYCVVAAGLGASIPMMFRTLKFNIFSGHAAALLKGAMPAPFFAYAEFDFECSILFLDIPTVHLSITLGEDCN